VTISHNEIEDIVDRAVRKTLEHFGIDVDNPQAMRMDFMHARKSRLLTEKVGATTITGTIGIMVSGVAYAIWQALTAGRH
jgi:hypothetical protein